MFKFLLYQWKLRKITETNLSQAVQKGWITKAEKDEIVAVLLD